MIVIITLVIVNCCGLFGLDRRVHECHRRVTRNKQAVADVAMGDSGRLRGSALDLVLAKV